MDISDHQSQNVTEFEGVVFDWVFAVCDHAHQCCPEFSGNGKRVAATFDDPPALAKQLPEGADKLQPYRRVRDEIRDFIVSLDLQATSEHEVLKGKLETV